MSYNRLTSIRSNQNAYTRRIGRISERIVGTQMSYHQTIYNLLRQAGMTEAGALGKLGNWECESNCEPYRVQGDYASNRMLSKEYVAKIMNGTISRDQFAHDQKGFGLAQWTYFTRKYELYDFWKSYGGRIDSVQMQVEFAIKELKRDFIPDWRLLCSTSDIYEATKAVCLRFENPAVKNVDARYHAALNIKAELQLGEWEKTEVVIPGEPEKPSSGWELIPATEYWPPRVLCKGMSGPDVELLQAILKARGWLQQNPDGIFGSFLEEKVKAFQQAYGLDVDGIVGPQTWGELLKR